MGSMIWGYPVLGSVVLGCIVCGVWHDVYIIESMVWGLLYGGLWYSIL